MIEAKDREHWRRAQKTRRRAAIGVAVAIALLTTTLVYNSFVVLRIALTSPGLNEAVQEAFFLGWNGVSQAETYWGYVIWIRDVLGGAILSATGLAALIAGVATFRREFQREARMWSHIDWLEKELEKARSTDAKRAGEVGS